MAKPLPTYHNTAPQPMRGQHNKTTLKGIGCPILPASAIV
jgi:hypothetical protein